jgi:hypothetical protein
MSRYLNKKNRLINAYNYLTYFEVSELKKEQDAIDASKHKLNPFYPNKATKLSNFLNDVISSFELEFNDE